MEYQPSKKLGHTYVLSRLVPKKAEPLEDTVTAVLQSGMEKIRFVQRSTRVTNYA